MLLIAGPYESTLTALGLKSFNSIAAAFGPDQPPRKSGAFVQPRTLNLPGEPPASIFYKQYFHQPPSLGFLGRPSKARREYDNYETFASMICSCVRLLSGYTA